IFSNLSAFSFNQLAGLSHHLNASKISIVTSSNLLLISLAGTPPTIVYGETFLVTTAPLAIIEPFPIVTPSSILTPVPIHTSLPIIRDHFLSSSTYLNSSYLFSSTYDKEDLDE